MSNTSLSVFQSFEISVLLERWDGVSADTLGDVSKVQWGGWDIHKVFPFCHPKTLSLMHSCQYLLLVYFVMLCNKREISEYQKIYPFHHLFTFNIVQIIYQSDSHHYSIRMLDPDICKHFVIWMYFTIIWQLKVMYNSAIYLHIIYKYQHVHNHEICSYITYNILVYLIHVYTLRYRITNEIKCEKTFWKMFLLNSEINVSSCQFSIVCLGRCPVQMKAEPQIQRVLSLQKRDPTRWHAFSSPGPRLHLQISTTLDTLPQTLTWEVLEDSHFMC